MEKYIELTNPSSYLKRKDNLRDRHPQYTCTCRLLDCLSNLSLNEQMRVFSVSLVLCCCFNFLGSECRNSFHLKEFLFGLGSPRHDCMLLDIFATRSSLTIVKRCCFSYMWLMQRRFVKLVMNMYRKYKHAHTMSNRMCT